MTLNTKNDFFFQFSIAVVILNATTSYFQWHTKEQKFNHDKNTENKIAKYSCYLHKKPV